MILALAMAQGWGGKTLKWKTFTCVNAIYLKLEINIYENTVTHLVKDK